MEAHETTRGRLVRRWLVLLGVGVLPLLGTGCVWAHGCHDPCPVEVGAFFVGAVLAASHCH